MILLSICQMFRYVIVREISFLSTNLVNIIQFVKKIRLFMRFTSPLQIQTKLSLQFLETVAILWQLCNSASSPENTAFID